ncbi:MAG: hypothetical protein WD226_02715 [Planctomycetota bacterium]
MLRPLFLLACLACPTVAQTAIKEPKSYEEALQQYEAYSKLESFFLHSLTWARLARSKDPRALPLLIAEYEDTGKPKQVRRHLLASIATRTFVDDASVEPLAAWRARHDDAHDAWLWYRTLSVDARNRGPEACLAVLRDMKAPLALRGAALEALGWCREPAGLYTAIAETATNLPPKAEEKALLAGAMGTALERHRRKAETREFKAACSYFINLLDDSHELSVSAKLVVARALGRILGTDEIVINTAPWIARLGDKQARITKADELGYVRPKFFGVEASGTRFCFVVDMSDSMCKPVDVPDEWKRGPVSGGGEVEDDGRGDIPWHLVETRFDLAREQLKLSLRGLDPDALFAVIYFGDRAELMDTCKGMGKASKSAIKKAIKELDDIEMKPPIPARPDGVLRGKTNLHGGLRAAFRVKKKGLLDEHSYVDPVSFREGADTIFLLSDGDPSWDDYDVRDKNVGEVHIGDPETGARSNDNGGLLHYSGPFRNVDVLIEDLERLNLFREVQIQCVTIGKDATRATLDRIAELGHGTVTQLGN